MCRRDPTSGAEALALSLQAAIGSFADPSSSRTACTSEIGHADATLRHSAFTAGARGAAETKHIIDGTSTDTVRAKAAAIGADHSTASHDASTHNAVVAALADGLCQASSGVTSSS